MKAKHIIIATLAAMALPMAAQEASDSYRPLIEQGKVWRYIGLVESLIGPRDFRPMEITIGNEVTRNGKTYYECNATRKGADGSLTTGVPFILRESVSERKVWVSYNFDEMSDFLMDMPSYDFYPPQEEYLLYDFNNPAESQIFNTTSHFNISPYEYWGPDVFIPGVGYAPPSPDLDNHWAEETLANVSWLGGYNILISTGLIYGPFPYLYEVREGDEVLYYNDHNAEFVGVATVGADADAPAEYFNLQGIRVANPQPGQLVVKKQGATARKVVYSD